MSPTEHHIDLSILSPSGTVTVGSDRKLSVTIRAFEFVKKQPVDPDPVDPGNPGGPVRPKGGGRNRPGKDIQPLDDNRMEVDAVEIKLGANGKFKKAKQLHSSFKWKFTDKVPSTGKLNIKARAKSKIGHASGGIDTQTVTVKEDNTPPDLKIDFPRPDHIEEGGGPDFNVDVEGTASHKEGIKSVHIGVDKATKRIARSSGDWNNDLKLRGTGDHRIVVRAVNEVGNERTQGLTVTTVDTGEPEMKITSPGSDERTFNWPVDEDLTIEVTGRAKDKGTGVKSVKWHLGDEEETVSINSDPGDWSQWSAEIPIPEPGEHKVEFICLDRAKRPNETTEEITINAEDNPPEATNITPSSPYTIPPEQGVVTVEVKGEIEDAVAEVSAVEWAFNESDDYERTEPLEDDWSKWRFSVDIEEAGIHTIRMRTGHASGTFSEPKTLKIEREEEI